MKALMKKVGQDPEPIEIANKLRDLQEAVGGFIQAVPEYTAAGEIAVICDEMGLLKGYPPNCSVCGVAYHGTILIVGVSGSDFVDLDDKTAEFMKKNIHPFR